MNRNKRPTASSSRHTEAPIRPTSAMGIITDLVADLGRQVRWNRDALVKTAATLTEAAGSLEGDPLNALEWSGDAYRDASRLKVASYVLTHFEKIEDKVQALTCAIEWLDEEVSRVQYGMARSSSATHNAGEIALFAAKAEMLRKLKSNLAQFYDRMNRIAMFDGSAP